MRRSVGIIGLLMLAGCSAKHAVSPRFSVRQCPDSSVRHVVCVGSFAEGVSACPSGGHLEERCFDKATNGEGVFNIGVGCNPYVDIDCDEAQEDKEMKKRAWWKFWDRVHGDKD